MANERYIAPQDNTYVRPANAPKPLTLWDVLLQAKAAEQMPTDAIVYDREFHTGATSIGPGPAQDDYLSTVAKYMRPAVRDIVSGAAGLYTDASNALGSTFDAIVPPEDRESAQQYYEGVSASQPFLSATGALADIAGLAAGPGSELLRSSVADPINIATLPLGVSRLGALAKDARYTPAGWAMADKFDNLVNPGIWVETPNYSRMGSSASIVGMAGDDANIATGPNLYTPNMEPAEYHPDPRARVLNRDRLSVGNGNHRMMLDRLLGVKTLAEDNDVFETLAHGQDVLGHKKYPGVWIDRAQALEPNNTDAASGRRLVKIPGIVDVADASKAEIDALARDRAKGASQYLKDKPLEEMLFKMSDGYSFPGAGGPVNYGGFLSYYTGKNPQNVVLNNPFKEIDNIGDKTLNPVHQWLLKKETDGTLQKTLMDMGLGNHNITTLAGDDALAIKVLDALEPAIQQDYVKWVADNGITPRPQIRWTKN